MNYNIKIFIKNMLMCLVFACAFFWILREIVINF